jgi:hypothetical protein
MPQQKKTVNWRAWLVGGLVALVLIVALQNSQEVSFDVLFASFKAPLIVVILLAGCDRGPDRLRRACHEAASPGRSARQRLIS